MPCQGRSTDPQVPVCRLHSARGGQCTQDVQSVGPFCCWLPSFFLFFFVFFVFFIFFVFFVFFLLRLLSPSSSFSFVLVLLCLLSSSFFFFLRLLPLCLLLLSSSFFIFFLFVFFFFLLLLLSSFFFLLLLLPSPEHRYYRFLTFQFPSRVLRGLTAHGCRERSSEDWFLPVHLYCIQPWSGRAGGTVGETGAAYTGTYGCCPG